MKYYELWTAYLPMVVVAGLFVGFIVTAAVVERSIDLAMECCWKRFECY